MGHERAHAELGGQGECPPVVLFGGLHVRRVGLRGNLAEEAEGPRLVTPLTALAGERQGAVGARAGVLDLVREQVRLAELHDTERVQVADPRGFVGCQRLLAARGRPPRCVPTTRTRAPETPSRPEQQT